MGAAFDGEPVFAVGPARFSVGPVGAFLLVGAREDPSDPSTVAVGAIELDVRVEGRVVGDDDVEWQERVEGLEALMAVPPRMGVLEDGRGRVWAGMSLIRLERAGPVDRGRKVSQGYAMVFRRFTV